MNPTRTKQEVVAGRKRLPAALATPSAAAAQGAGTGAAPQPRARRRPMRGLFEAVAKPFDGAAGPARRLLSRRWHSRAWAGMALAALVSLRLVTLGQEATGLSQTNTFLPANELVGTNLLMRTNDFFEEDDLLGTNEVVSTNGTVASQRSIATDLVAQRNRRDRWQRSDRSGGSSRRDGSGSRNNLPAPPTSMDSSSNSLEFAAFKVIGDRNIFDPNRYARQPGVGPRPKPRVTESFALVGTMSYEKGTFAFFDGTSAEYRKVLKPADAIAGYRVTTVAANSVKLAAGTNQVDLHVGMQMRREDEGEWLLAGRADSYASAGTGATVSVTTSSSADPAAVPAGEESEILKRMMQRREKE